MDSIAFDLDGTLIDISRRDYEIYTYILSLFDCKPLNFKLYWELRRRKTDIFKILSLSKLERAKNSEFIEIRGRLIESPIYLAIDNLFDSSVKTLQAVSTEYACYLVTKRQNSKDTIAQIEKLGIEIFFNDIIVTNENKSNSFKRIENLHYVIGDTENDIIPAKENGIKSIAVTTGIRNKHYLNQLSPDYLITDLYELVSILGIDEKK